MRKYSWRRPMREKAVAVNTMYGSCVRPKIAGMESRANSRSVPPMATMTSSIGVMTFLPSMCVNSLSPSYSSEVCMNRLARRMTMLSASFSSSLSVTSSLTRLPAV
ncbi:Uncharacterised protein [Mycobacteroides abscessus subsp. abscessus]|nr:Uncharacterised protein [Mycobacteroides abscessus subsp. abscessus]